MNHRLNALICGGWVLFAAGLGIAQEWTQFRGPNGTGISHVQGIPSTWDEDDFEWSVGLPGGGHSSPVIWGDRVYISAGDAEAAQVRLLAIDIRTGKEVWRHGVRFKPYQQHRFNQFAASTAAVDENRVYFYQPGVDRSVLMALSHEGEELWTHDLVAIESQHGGATSPIVYDGKVILANDHLGESYLIALDAASGEPVWKTQRRTADKAAYGIPCLYDNGQEAPSLIFNSEQHGISAIDPDSGKLLWEINGVFDKRSVSSSLVAGGMLIGSCGSGGGGNYIVAVKPGDRAGKKPELAYEIRRSAPYVPTSVAYGDLLFLWSDGGVASCVHAPTGEVYWTERVGGNFFASPIWLDGRVFNISREGEVVVIDASKDFEVLGRIDLDETSHATPAVAKDRLFLRTLSRLYCLKSKTPTS